MYSVYLLHLYLLNLFDILIKLGTSVLLVTFGPLGLGEGLNLEWWSGNLDPGYIQTCRFPVEKATGFEQDAFIRCGDRFFA